MSSLDSLAPELIQQIGRRVHRKSVNDSDSSDTVVERILHVSASGVWWKVKLAWSSFSCSTSDWKSRMSSACLSLRSLGLLFRFAMRVVSELISCG